MSYIEDPLDSEDFDSVQFINQRFPTESSLEDLDSFITDIGAQISSLDEEISKAVQNQSVIGKQASQDIVETQKSIEELFGKIHDIKLKASQSERMVQEICADIKKLDYAKNHLQTSITSLNRLQMLVSAVDQLEILAKDQQYREVANLLDAVKQFMTHFDRYTHITIIQEVLRRVDAIKAGLSSHIGSMFNKLAETADTVADTELVIKDTLGLPGGLRSLGDCCLVVDSLGPRTRRELLEQFVQLQLVQYENLFGSGQQHFHLEQVDRRWSWFKRLLKYIDSKFGAVFPSHWRLPLRLCLEFTDRTKIHLILLLTEMESNDNGDVHALLKALQSALRFEQEMTERFHLLRELQKSRETEEATARMAAQEKAMQMRLKKEDKLMYVPTDHDAINQEDETESGFLSLANSAINGGISGVFDKFLGSYVLLERQNLEDMLKRLGEEEDTTSEGVGMSGGSQQGSTGYGNVYGSSMNMFVFIKNSIKRCTALTTGQTFLSLSMEFQACMHQYVDMLRSRCPPGSGGSGGQAQVFKLAPGGEVGICYLINTGEYCAEVVPQLEQMVQQKMADNLASKVNFEEEVDAFMDLVAHCIKVLVAGIMDRLDPAFRTMNSIPWGTATQVGEESAYLFTANAVLMDAIPKIRDSLSPSYFNNICTKIASEILARYQDIIVKQKRISDIATQQLLLDTYSVKAMLLQMPQMVHPHSEDDAKKTGAAPKPSAPMYVKLVNNKVAHIEMILKLVGTPDDMLLDRFKIMWPGGQSADLQMLMALKGMKRNDQQVILEMLGLSAASKKLSSGLLSGGAAGGAGAGGGGRSQSPLPAGGAAGTGAGASSSYSVAASAAASAASSMKTFTHDISSTARSAVGNLKWSST